MNKTFKGLIADDGKVRIRLSTNDGLTGYRIVKFEAFANTPGATVNAEHLLQVYTVDTAASGTVNFDNPTLLAANYLPIKTSEFSHIENVIIDNKIFNQDIFVTHVDVSGTASCNYYLELEQVKLDLNEATVATLKDMRGRE
jgi:hypothetical protein